jgi:ADP-ribosyl-[dinitrogen reductase] hydrolase
MDRPLENTYWVLPDILLAGEYPCGGTAAETRARLRGLLDAGIDFFLDLTEAAECPEYESLLPAHVRYLRSPIIDASVPQDTAQMRAIQAQLQTALASGRRVYVHCRAGVGRTATVIGCYLVEQAADGREALKQLNRLWRACARSALWPVVPQTREQAAFIRDWPKHRQPLGQAAGLPALRALRGRYLGCLLGLALGDALGAATQQRPPGSLAPVGDLVGAGFDLPRGSWSDDTAMTLCLAESLLESHGTEPQDQLRRYARWQRQGHLAAGGRAEGITATTARVLRRRASAPTAAGATRSHEAAPLSRVAPAVLFYFAEEAQAIQQAAAAAQLFDAAPLVLDCCRVLAAMLHTALRGEPLVRILRPPLAVFRTRPLAAAVTAMLDRAPMLPPAATAEPALTALSAARWALASGGGFRAGALRAANIGGDADVIGAIHGQLAGAFYGPQAIPADWLEALARRALIDDMADRLLSAAALRLAEDRA